MGEAAHGLEGEGDGVDAPPAGTSNTYPCRTPAAEMSVVSSQLSQVPAGVGPPAQLRMVPLRLA